MLDAQASETDENGWDFPRMELFCSLCGNKKPLANEDPMRHSHAEVFPNLSLGQIRKKITGSGVTRF